MQRLEKQMLLVLRQCWLDLSPNYAEAKTQPQNERILFCLSTRFFTKNVTVYLSSLVIRR